LKESFTDPRPYLQNPNIKPQHCTISFAYPSGHSMGASFAATGIFLDLFHSTPISFQFQRDFNIIYSNIVYYICLVFAIYWQTSIPYSRYLNGMHTVD